MQDERTRMENLIPKLHEEICAGLAKLHEIEQVELTIKKFRDQIDDNKDFEYEVTMYQPYTEPLPAGIYNTTCMICNRSCHSKCTCANNEEKTTCDVLKHGYCSICPRHCYWDKHVNLPYVIKYRQVKQKKSHDFLKKRYDPSVYGLSRSDTMLSKNELVFFDLQYIVFDMIIKANTYVKQLNDITLKSSNLSLVEYIDLLIETENVEKHHGWSERVEQYTDIRKNAVLLVQINLPIDDPRCIDHLEVLIEEEEKKSENDRDKSQIATYRKFYSLLKRAKTLAEPTSIMVT